jgi:hypothetical protein
LSTQQETLIELAARSKIMLDSVDNWILGQPTLINSRKKSIIAVVQQRQVIADGLTRVLKELGLERKAPPEEDLQDFLAKNYPGNRDNGNGDGDEQATRLVTELKPTTEPTPADGTAPED